MSRIINYVPRVAIFLAGVATAALTMPRRERAPSGDTAPLDELKKALADLEAKMEGRGATDAARFERVEAKLEEHAAKLAEMPSTTQIVAAMEQLLTKTMASLDDRLTSQARSIEVLRTTVSQTDGLLERVLESLDTLQGYSDSSEFSEDPLLSRPAV
jgi:chromosome segregation ATPase